MTEAEYEEIVNNMWGETLRVVNRKVSPVEEAEDIVLDVFDKLWRYKDSIDPAKVEHWVNRVARTTVVDYYRKRRMEVLPLFMEEYRRDHNRFSDPFYSFCVRDGAEAILEEMDRSMSKAQVLVIHLSFGQGKTPTEVGAILGIKPCAASAQKRRALANLRALARRIPGLFI